MHNHRHTCLRLLGQEIHRDISHKDNKLLYMWRFRHYHRWDKYPHNPAYLLACQVDIDDCNLVVLDHHPRGKHRYKYLDSLVLDYHRDTLEQFVGRVQTSETPLRW